MTTIAFDADSFRRQIIAYSDPILYPDEVLQVYWDQATCFVSNEYGDCWTSEGCLRTALNYMTAHLIYLANLIASNGNQGVSGIVTQSTVDKTSVTLVAPPGSESQFKYWLNQSPYGQALLALLSAQGAGGLMGGFVAPRGGIRQPSGGFLF